MSQHTTCAGAPAAPDLRHRAAFRYLDRLRVRWAEVDMQKIVFNGHYLMYFDTAIAGYWRALALPYHETMEALSGDMFVRKATVEYEGSARYDDLCEVGVRCQRIGKSSMVFALALFRGETRLVHGELVYVFADPATQTSRPVPASLREVLEGYEGGRPVLDCQVGGWGTLGHDARRLRQAVFEAEMGVRQNMTEDAADPAALHAVAYNRFGLAVGTGRLAVVQAPGRARIARVAVHGALRGAGVGAALVRALVAAARSRGDHEVVLSAQASVQRFYGRLGFATQGQPYEEAGQPHQDMAMTL
ncbi:MAG: YbgC/FadM family acyl-CoA thioesterase [Rubrivivax sp.]|nr:YbgC/FadM family acyl-CoA thioesterase [Rubrivivax sp.]